MAIAVSVHELGHLLMLLSLGIPIFGMHFSLTGPAICCGTADNRIQEVMISLSGPVMGLLLFLLIRWDSPFCAEMSLYLTIINMLPILPLDGGRAVAALLPERMIRIGSLILSVLTILGGLYFFSIGQGAGLFLFGGCLLILACHSPGHDVK